MKKTLTTLLCTVFASGIAGAVMEDTDYDITLDFVSITPTYVADADVNSLPYKLVGAAHAGNLTTANAASVTSTNYVNSFLSPNVNVGSTSGATWTYTYTFTAGADFALNNVTLVLPTFNGSGKTQNAESSKTSNLTVTLTSNDVAIIESYNNQATTYAGANTSVAQDGALSYNLADRTLKSGTQNASGTFLTLNGLADGNNIVHAGDIVKLTITAANGTDVGASYGHFVGLKAVNFNVTVPEPATATLSLLALAGLAARRRRK